jgi:biotin-(acetyl-CoA carboxylase) ligase
VPNDLYCGDGLKLGGILVEASGEPQRVEWAVVGCGINVRSLGMAPEGACHLDELTDRWVPLAVAAAVVLDELAAAYLEYRSDGFERLREEYLGKAFLTGRDVTVR